MEFLVDAATQERLNPEGINCLRALSGRGLRVWGARTLSPDPNWLYINVRRLVLTLARWIDRNMGWAAFEANTARLWNRIQRELNVYLAGLWQAGAIKGASAAEAFYVKCDSETNPAEEREQGRVTTEIGLAPASPAEFVVVRVVHRPGAAQLS
jgi:phage tail sheath protein FI